MEKTFTGTAARIGVAAEAVRNPAGKTTRPALAPGQAANSAALSRALNGSVGRFKARD